MTVYKLTLSKAITADYILFNCLVFPVISLIVIIVTAGNPLLIGILAILSFVALVIGGFRFIKILKIINENQMVDAIISHVYFYRGRGTINFRFVYHGENFNSKLHVIKTKSSTSYKPGDRIHALVDWNDPRKALITDLYADPREQL